jgi:hypothetical protein
LWRSDDGGRAWQNVSWDRRLIGRAGYYIRIRVSPDDPDHLMIANSTLWRSRASFAATARRAPPWRQPSNASIAPTRTVRGARSTR